MIESQLYLDVRARRSLDDAYGKPVYAAVTATGRWRLVTTMYRANELQLEVEQPRCLPEWASEDYLTLGYPEQVVEFDSRS